jgi:hypothetical protein
MSTTDVHYTILENLSTSFDLMSITSIDKPAAIAMIGQPSEGDPAGYTVISGKSLTVVSAAGELSRWMQDREWVQAHAAPFIAPASAVFAFRWAEPGVNMVVGWSVGGSTAGRIEAHQHPEVPCRIVLSPASPPARPIFPSNHALSVIVALRDEHELCEGVW